MGPTPTPTVFSPATLPCGRTVPNRLAKVALYEHLCNFFGGPPNKHHFALYEAWSKGPVGYGIVMTGNVMVSRDHLTLGRDMVLPAHTTADSLAPFARLAESIHSNSQSLAIMQLNHSGRQSSRLSGSLKGPLAPSSMCLGHDIPWSNFFSKLLFSLLFQTPRAMSLDDIEHVISRFVFGAQLAHESGFDGVQIHAAHGYLLTQFMSSATNTRTDDFSVTDGNDLRLLHTILTRVREVVPKEFVIGIKLNAADYTSSNNAATTPKQEQALNHIKTIAQWGGVDFIEISGGDYESPDFMSQRPKSQRQAYFAYMSSKAIETLESMPRPVNSPPLPLILLTGGLKSPFSLQSALKNKHAQLLGVGRSSIICPHLPAVLDSLGNDTETWPDTPFGPEPQDSLPAFVPKVPLLGATTGLAWYEMQMRYMAQRNGADPQKVKVPYPDYSLTGWGALFAMWFWFSDVGRFRTFQRPLLYLVGIGVSITLTAHCKSQEYASAIFQGWSGSKI